MESDLVKLIEAKYYWSWSTLAWRHQTILLNQHWLIVNCILRNKIMWIFNQHSNIAFLKENAFKVVKKKNGSNLGQISLYMS